jgi:hypothetical protein
VSTELDSLFYSNVYSRILTLTSNDHYYDPLLKNGTSSPVFYNLMVRAQECTFDFALHSGAITSHFDVFFSISVSLLSFESFSTFLPGHV